uniref:Uncharacterized protein n=1 Tax=Arundo donax TaxID=35708 RepID=A0A0A9FWK0_ARUDO
MSNISFLASSSRPASQRPCINRAYVTAFGDTPRRAISSVSRSAAASSPSRHAEPTSVLNVTTVGRTPRPSISSSTPRAPANPSRWQTPLRMMLYDTALVRTPSLGDSGSMSRAASTRPLQTREWRRAWNVALECEQKARTARKTRTAASGREAAPKWSMRAAKAVGCSGTRRERSAERRGRTSGKRRARARR